MPRKVALQAWNVAWVPSCGSWLLLTFAAGACAVISRAETQATKLDSVVVRLERELSSEQIVLRERLELRGSGRLERVLTTKDGDTRSVVPIYRKEFVGLLDLLNRVGFLSLPDQFVSADRIDYVDEEDVHVSGTAASHALRRQVSIDIGAVTKRVVFQDVGCPPEGLFRIEEYIDDLARSHGVDRPWTKMIVSARKARATCPM